MRPSVDGSDRTQTVRGFPWATSEAPSHTAEYQGASLVRVVQWGRYAGD